MAYIKHVGKHLAIDHHDGAMQLEEKAVGRLQYEVWLLALCSEMSNAIESW